MPGEFLAGFFASPGTGAQYGKASRTFLIAGWLDSPLTTGQGTIWRWWREKYDTFANLLDGDVARNFKNPNKWVAPVSIALERLFDQAHFPAAPGVQRQDLLEALVGSLSGLRDDLEIVMRKQADKNGLDSALRDLVDASFTVAMSAVATLENEARQRAARSEPFGATLGELFLRDRSSVLNETAGALPPDLRYGDEDTPLGYLTKALEFAAVHWAGWEMNRDLLALVTTVEEADGVLRRGVGQARDDARAQRRQALTGLAELAQELGRRVQDPSMLPHTRGEAAVLGGLLAEGMRGVLGLPPQRHGALTEPEPVDYAHLVDRRAAELRREVTDREMRDPFYRGYEHGR